MSLDKKSSSLSGSRKFLLAVALGIAIFTGLTLYSQNQEHQRLMKYWQAKHAADESAWLTKEELKILPIVLAGPRKFNTMPLPNWVDGPELDLSKMISPQEEFIWPGCIYLMNNKYLQEMSLNSPPLLSQYLNKSKNKLSSFEKGYCVGIYLAKFSFNSGSSTNNVGEMQKLAYDKFENQNQSEEICTSAAGLNLDWYKEAGSASDSSSEFILGCKFGASETYPYWEQNAQAKNLIRIQTPRQPLPSPTSSNKPVSQGHWVRTCHWINVPNPRYNGSEPSINQRLANGPPFITTQQCTDQFVK
jgi:hypothetical protein